MSALVMQAAKGRLYGSGLTHVARIGGQCRAVWNLFLAESVARYRDEQKFVFYTEMSARLPKLLKEDARLSGLPHRCAQMTVQRLDRALRDCAKSRGKTRRGFPHFKRYADRRDAFSFVGREIRLAEGRVRLPKIGWLRVRGLRMPEGADLKQVAVTQEPRGWHLSIQFEAAPKSYATATRPLVGLDAGIRKRDDNDRTIATLRDGRRIISPQWVEKAEARLRRLNRIRDRRRKGSVNRKRIVARIGKVHRDVRNARLNFLHKQTNKLVDRYAGFAVEDLSLQGLVRTRLAKSFASAALGEMLRQLAYKAVWAGREWRTMPRFERSTGVCPDCGWVGPRMLLSVRTWRCEGCGLEHDRDVAAARVIELRAVGVANPEPAEGTRRKRGAVVRGGGEAIALPSHAESPANVAFVGEIR
jgi:putative transposase